jgi:hypothetical protein
MIEIDRKYFLVIENDPSILVRMGIVQEQFEVIEIDPNHFLVIENDPSILVRIEMDKE